MRAYHSLVHSRKMSVAQGKIAIQRRGPLMQKRSVMQKLADGSTPTWNASLALLKRQSAQ